MLRVLLFCFLLGFAARSFGQWATSSQMDDLINGVDTVGANVNQTKTHIDNVKYAVEDLETALLELQRDDLKPISRYSGVASQALTNLLVWFQGVDSTPMNVRPFWQNLTPGGTQSYLSQANNWDSFQNFLGYTLGTFVYGSTANNALNGNPGVIAWENAFLPSSSNPTSQKGVRPGYGYFTVWLAEAMRREINMTSNLWAKDGWIALNGSTSEVDAVSSYRNEQLEEDAVNETSISNAVADLDEYIEEQTPDDHDLDDSLTNQYDNSNDFYDGMIGPDNGSASFTKAILLASSSDVASIAAAAGIRLPSNTRSAPSIEWSFGSPGGSDVASGVARVKSGMGTVWNWVTSISIFYVVLYWYRRCRAFVFSIANHMPARGEGGF